MACIVYQTDKRTGIKYAYSSQSYWDKDKKQPRSKRTFLGRLDPDTGEIIKKKDRAKPAKEALNEAPDTSALVAGLRKELDEKNKLITSLEDANRHLAAKYEEAKALIQAISKALDSFRGD